MAPKDVTNAVSFPPSKRRPRKTLPGSYRKKVSGVFVDHKVILLTLLHTKARNNRNPLFLVGNNGPNSCGMFFRGSLLEMKDRAAVVG